jgi:hypothetical protein
MAQNQITNAKQTTPISSEGTSQEQKRVQAGCLLRFLWMLIGNIALLATAAFISREPPWTFSIADGIFGALVIALIGIRFADITWFQGTTAKNEPATRAHWIRYSIGLVIVAVVIWVLVQSV